MIDGMDAGYLKRVGAGHVLAGYWMGLVLFDAMDVEFLQRMTASKSVVSFYWTMDKGPAATLGDGMDWFDWDRIWVWVLGKAIGITIQIESKLSKTIAGSMTTGTMTIVMWVD